MRIKDKRMRFKKVMITKLKKLKPEIKKCKIN
jgi:hypothetical protein